MGRPLSARTLRRLDIQGFEDVDPRRLAEIAPWQRLSFGLCAVIAAAGTAAASPGTLLMLAPIAAIGAASPVHPFDLLYNHAICRLTGTRPLPGRGAPSRFTCGVVAVGLIATAWAFSSGYPSFGYSLGTVLTILALLIGTTDICLVSMLYRSANGWPRARRQPRRAELPFGRVSVPSTPG